MERLLLTVSEAADCIGIGRTKMYELIARGEIKVVRIGRCVRVPARFLEAWVMSQTQEDGEYVGH